MTTTIIALVVGFSLLTTVPNEGDPALNLADLEAYRLALRPDPRPDRAEVVGFGDLWRRPEAYAGRTVRVEGRLARLFRQPGLGEFPALAEAWVLSPEGDPICLVYPDVPAAVATEVGSEIRFTGTFLRRVKYRGGDMPRLAPLIVGPRPPSMVGAIPARAWPGSPGEWLLGLGAASVVAAILAGRHLARPPARPSPIEPPPAFVDGAGPPDRGAFDDDLTT